MSEHDTELANDLLVGARQIARFLYGSDSDKERRRVFHLTATSRIPFFKIGSRTCARKSVLRAWIKQQEDRHLGESLKDK